MTRLLLAALLAGCASQGVPTAPAGKKNAVVPFRFGEPDVVLLVTGSMNGILEPCNCASGMPGGLSRRAGLVKKYRERFPRTVLIDTGDAFRGGEPHNPRNQFVLRGYREIGYDALVLGMHEWSTPLHDLESWLKKGDVAYLSSTVAPKSARLPLTRVVTREWEGLKLAIVSDIRRDVPLFVGERRMEELKFAPPRKLAALVSRLKKADTVVVAVSHGVDLQVRKTVKSVHADLILQGHFPTSEPKLLRVGGKPVARIGGVEYVGVIGLKVESGMVTDLEYRLEVADDRWPIDRRLLKTYEDYADAALPKMLEAKREEGLAYVDAKTCGDCHQREFEAWQKSRHAHAYDTLEQAGRTKDPDCLRCHTTGFTTTRGFYSRKKTPGLANVNCQVCHQFEMDEHGGGGFSGEPVDEKLCRTCHTDVADPKWNFKKRMAHISCIEGH